MTRNDRPVHDLSGGAGPLAGRTALVTGAARGIGRAVALELAAMGAGVAVAGRRADDVEPTAEAARELGVPARALGCDLRDQAAIERLVTEVDAVDCLVHNAAAFAPYVPLEELPAGELERVLDVVVRAPIALTRTFIAGMKQRGFGRVVAVGTIAAESGAAGQAAYATAKAGLVGLVRSLAAEGARAGVTCNLVQPGLIDTERVQESIAPEWQRRILASTAMGRAGTAEEVAAVIGFLCSPRASYVTGAVIPVSGGFGVGLYARDPD